MDSKMLIVGALLLVFAACAIAYGLWLRKDGGEGEGGAKR